MRLRQPLPKQGPGKARWKVHHDTERTAVMLRCRGRCENSACQKLTRYLEWAHLMSRGHLIEEPYCSSRHLTRALCCFDPLTSSIGCHETIDRGLNPKLRHQLQVDCAKDFYAAHKAKKIALIQTEPVGAVRRLVIKLEKAAA